MSLAALKVPETHLALLCGELACDGCREKATRWVRCKTCRKVLARCGDPKCGNDMNRIQKGHCEV